MLRRFTGALHPRTSLLCLRSALRYQPVPWQRTMSSRLPAVDPPLSTALPSDSYQLLPTNEKAGSREDTLFDRQVEDVRQWWGSERYKSIKRPYTAEDIVSKRGALQQTYASSLMARKLFNLLKERAAAGEPVHTMGAIDPVQVRFEGTLPFCVLYLGVQARPCSWNLIESARNVPC